jgi:3',5'-cyclic AMP phosphodiesterase CpdA
MLSFLVRPVVATLPHSHFLDTPGVALRPAMITLAHISDVHLAPLPPVRIRELMSKRITGYLNWKLRRQKALGGDGLRTLVNHMREQRPDFTAVTGDITNLSLPAEHKTALAWLKTVGDPSEVCVSPGNHDAYVPGALRAARTLWGDYCRGETVDRRNFPFVRRVGEVAIVSCSSAIATAPWMASGRFSANQGRRLRRCLQMLGDGGYFRVVLIHHPPSHEGNNLRYGLWGAPTFREVVAETGAELVLHGHTHRSSIHAIAGPSAEVPVIGVAAAGAAQSARTADDPARYNLFKIERVGTTWSCTMREYGFQRLGTEIVLRLQIRIY